MNDTSLSRRKFVTGASAIVASAAVLSAFGCTPGTSVKKTSSDAEHTVGANPEEGGSWISVACWHKIRLH